MDPTLHFKLSTFFNVLAICTETFPSIKCPILIFYICFPEGMELNLKNVETDRINLKILFKIIQSLFKISSNDVKSGYFYFIQLEHTKRFVAIQG